MSAKGIWVDRLEAHPFTVAVGLITVGGGFVIALAAWWAR